MKNVGTTDRAIRIVVGLGILVWGFADQSYIGLVGLIPLATGLLGWCPAYCPIGINTAKSCCGGSCSTTQETK